MHPLYHQIAVQLNCLLSNQKLFDFHINSLLESLYHYLGDGHTMQADQRPFNLSTLVGRPEEGHSFFFRAYLGRSVMNSLENNV